MAKTTFSGPVQSNNGFIIPAVTTAQLPTAADTPVNTVYIITDNGAGNDERCIVINNGTAWVTAIGAALS